MLQLTTKHASHALQYNQHNLMTPVQSSLVLSKTDAPSKCLHFEGASDFARTHEHWTGVIKLCWLNWRAWDACFVVNWSIFDYVLFPMAQHSLKKKIFLLDTWLALSSVGTKILMSIKIINWKQHRWRQVFFFFSENFCLILLKLWSLMVIPWTSMEMLWVQILVTTSLSDW